MKSFDKWLEDEIGVQDAAMFTKGSLIREVALKWGRYSRKKQKRNLKRLTTN